MPLIEAQAVHMRLVQYASSEMRRYNTDRRSPAHLSVQYAVVKLGYPAAVLIHGGEASPIGSSHNTTIRSLPKYPCPCYPRMPQSGYMPTTLPSRHTSTSDKALSVNYACRAAAALPHRCTPPCDGRAAPWSHRRVLAHIQVVGLFPSVRRQGLDPASRAEFIYQPGHAFL
jgi:hypothetical protein